MRQKMREMLTTRPSILVCTLAMVVVFALACPVRSAHALYECSHPGYCLSGFASCCQDPDGSFRGCCPDGTCCSGPDGKISACCKKDEACDTTTGGCVSSVSQCPADAISCSGPGGKFCCKKDEVCDTTTGGCVSHLFFCRTGQAKCGRTCCPTGQECAEPEAGLLHVHCCPKGQACGSFCKGELKSRGLKCCRGGGLLSGGVSFNAKTDTCCNGRVCNNSTERCVLNTKRGKNQGLCKPK